LQQIIEKKKKKADEKLGKGDPKPCCVMWHSWAVISWSLAPRTHNSILRYVFIKRLKLLYWLHKNVYMSVHVHVIKC
jgi:hypothetical protein